MTLPRISWRAGEPPQGAPDAWNGLLGIWTYAGTRWPVSIMAQELAEWRDRQKLALLFAALPMAGAVVAAVLVHIGTLALIPLAYALGYLASDQIPALRRRREYIGHAVSVVVAARIYSGGRDFFEAVHAGWIFKGGYDEFRNVSEQRIRIGLRARYTEAEVFADRNKALIRAWSDQVEKALRA